MHNYLYTTILIINSFFCFGQDRPSNHFICGHDIVMGQAREKNPKAFDEAERIFNSKNSAKALLKKNTDRNFNPNYDYIIPVVVHVVHNGESLGQGTNISYSQIQSQIDALNASFSNYSSNANYLQTNAGSQYDTPSRRGPYGVDTRIRFCLAPNLGVISPNGNHNTSETGVIRYNNSAQSMHQLNQAGQESLMQLTHPTLPVLPSSHYFNIWIVTSINTGTPGVEGYAPIPIDFPFVNNGSWPLRGVVVRSDVFGDNSINSNNYTLQPRLNPSVGGGNNGFDFSKGKILTHEIGHALGLYHTFNNYSQNGTDACNAAYGDLVSDTPPCNINGLPTYTGTGTRNSCAESPDQLDMVENYMYYSTDNVSNTFTAGQKLRMGSTIEEIYPELSSTLNLLQTGVISGSGCLAPILSAEFTVPANPCINQAVAFSGIQNSGNLATTWEWTIIPANGVVVGSPHSATTAISFPAVGNYQVTLTVTNNNISQSVTHVIDANACILDACAVQNGNLHAVFGAGVHMDFKTGAITFPTMPDGPDPFWSAESSFTQSDEHGNVLFYTNGVKVWDANLNSYSLGTPNNQLSAAQIIGTPFPGHPGKYVLFLPPAGELYSWDLPNYHFKFYTIEVKPTGLIISPPMLLPFPAGYDYPSEGITAVPHCNGRDFWIIIPFNSIGGKTTINTYLLSESGIKPTQSVGGILAGGLGWFPIMKMNREGNRLLLRNAFFDFDPSTGMTSIKHTFPQASFYYSQIYSADGRFIFRAHDFGIQIWKSDNPTPFQANNITLYQTINMPMSPMYHNFFLGADDQVYFKSTDGIAHLKNQNGVFTVDNQYVYGTLSSIPNAIDACRPELQLPDFTVSKIDCHEVSLNLTGCYKQYNVSIDWGDGSPDTSGLFSSLMTAPISHNYNQSGNYTVTMTLSISSLWDTNADGTLETNTVSLDPISKEVIITPTAVSIQGSKNVCNNFQPFQYVFNAGLNGMYQWSVTGSGNQILGTANGTGLNNVSVSWMNDGQLTVNYTEGTCTLTDVLDVERCETIDIVDDKCLIEITPNPVIDIMKIKSGTKISKVMVYNVLGQKIIDQDFSLMAVELNLSHLQSGNYFMKINSCNTQKVIKFIKL